MMSAGSTQPDLRARLAELLARGGRFTAARGALIGLLAFVALTARLCTAPAPPPKTLEGVAELLGGAVGGKVDADAFIWEPSGGAVRDLVIGRRVLFLASAPPGALRDLYRAQVRVSREGRPLAVRVVRNLTATTLADESQLIARERRVAYLTRAFEAIQGITVLDLDGYIRSAELPRATRWLLALDSWFQDGSTTGLPRLEVVFGSPPEKVQMELRDNHLVMALGEPPQALAVEALTAKLRTGGKEDLYQTSVWTIPRRMKSNGQHLVELLQQLLGTETADEIVALASRHRHRWLDAPPPPAATNDPTPAAEPPPEPATPASSTGWPPSRIPSRFAHPLADEGVWQPLSAGWVPELPGTLGKPEPYLVHTLVRPDRQLPEAVVRLVAIDTRQLELGIAAGYDEPRPLTGPRGSGRIPGQAQQHLVAAFNGAFTSREGRFGMVVDRRVLVPLVAGAASVAVDVTGHTLLGAWDGDAAVVPPWIVAVRQNLTPLLADGAINPAGRAHWGIPLHAGSFVAERSALCLNRDGYLVYGWGLEISAETLAEGLLLAGCRQAIHLDLNPGYVGFALAGLQQGRLAGELVSPEMSAVPERFFTVPSPKDFFYLTVRRRTLTAGGYEWRPDEGAHPPPAWLPAVHHATAEKLGAEVELWAIAPGRFVWQIRPGGDEKSGQTALGPLDPASHARAMVAVGLGVGLRKRSRRGLVLDGVISHPLHVGHGLIATTDQGRGIAVGRTVADMAPPGDATELPLVADGGEVVKSARLMRARLTRSAACQLDDGTLLIAVAAADNLEPLGAALLAAGCQRVVELNRGKQIRAFVHRAGTKDPPQSAYDDTVLYGMGVPARGTAVKLTPSEP